MDSDEVRNGLSVYQQRRGKVLVGLTYGWAGGRQRIVIGFSFVDPGKKQRMERADLLWLSAYAISFLVHGDKRTVNA